MLPTESQFVQASPPSRAWKLRKAKLLEDFKNFDQKSPVMHVLDLRDTGAAIEAFTQFDTKTLVKTQDGDVKLVGPVLTGIRYCESFLSKAPVPWEIVTVVFPMPVYHPNVNVGGGLCLGKPPANVPLDLILHMTWAALVMNTRLVTTTDWQVFNPEAAAYVRSHRDQFPLTERGLLEA